MILDTVLDYCTVVILWTNHGMCSLDSGVNDHPESWFCFMSLPFGLKELFMSHHVICHESTGITCSIKCDMNEPTKSSHLHDDVTRQNSDARAHVLNGIGFNFHWTSFCHRWRCQPNQQGTRWCIAFLFVHVFAADRWLLPVAKHQAKLQRIRNFLTGKQQTSKGFPLTTPHGLCPQQN